MIVGVDDATVDRYGEELMKVKAKVQGKNGYEQRIGFYSLSDIFFANTTLRNFFRADTVAKVDISHFLNTEITYEAEISRKILMAGCQIDSGALRSKIDGQDKSLLALYRGFSRFMLEDLEQHPSTISMTKSQRKKLSSKIAFEMISVSFPLKAIVS